MILVVDDDVDIVKLIELSLVKEGYKVLTANNGLDAINLFSKNNVSLAILDIMMPNIDGIEVCRKIREKSNIPIIFLSAKSTDVDKVIGLSIGADDYVIKPFSIIELIARVKSQIRRYSFLNNNSNCSSENLIRMHGMEIDETARRITLYGNYVNLTRTEFDILLLLAKNPGRVFTLEEIFEKVWKERYFEGNNTVMVHIARLRDKLGEGLRVNKIIQNVWGVGYKIEK